MKKIFALLFFFQSLALASIPNSRMILQRVVENSGTGAYVIEQEVMFTSGSDSLTLKETWSVVDGDTMRVTVVGTKELKDQIQMQFFYNGNNRWELSAGKKISRPISKEIIDRVLFQKHLESLGAFLIHNQIIPEGSLAKKMAAKKSSDYTYEPEKFVRLSRFGGVVNYAFGTPTPPGATTKNSGLWVEQDQFLIRKLILPSQVELVAEAYSNYAKGLVFPKQRTISFGSEVVQIKTLSVTARTNLNSLMSPGALEMEMKSDGLNNSPLKKSGLEFDERIR